MREMFLLGAGASIEANVPGVYDMTKRILEAFESDPLTLREKRVLYYVLGGLLFEAGIEGKNPLSEDVNVEALFSAVQLLAERNTLEAAPFVGSWHPMVEELDQVAAPSLAFGELSKALFETTRDELLDAFKGSPSPSSVKKIDTTLAKAIEKYVAAASKNRTASFTTQESLGAAVDDFLTSVVKKWIEGLKRSRGSGSMIQRDRVQQALAKSQARPGRGRVFEQTCKAMVHQLVKLVWITDVTKVNYLIPLVDLTKRREQLTVATLNYDNAIELAAASCNTSCSTGIERWSKTSGFGSPGTGVHLLKLHGSIDWRLRTMDNERGTLPHSVVEQVPADQVPGGDFTPAVVFGQRNKLTADGPFLALLSAFEHELAQSQTLTVIGYSFRDDHVNTYIGRWLNGDNSRVMRVIDPCFDKSKAPFVAALRDAFGETNQKLEIVKNTAGEAIQSLYGCSSE